MGLFDFGGSGDPTGGLYGNALTPEQQQAVSGRGLLGFLAGMQKSGALDYTVPFISGKVPGGLAAGLAGGLGGMGSAQDEAVKNALNAQLIGKEITAKDIEGQLARLNLEGWLRAQGIVGTNSSSMAPTAAPGMAAQPPQPRTQTADTSGAAGEYGVGQSGWPIPMLRTNEEFPALPPDSTNAPSSGPGWAPGSSPITPASYNPARMPLGQVPGLLGGNGAAPPVQLAQAAPAASGGLLSPSPARRPVPPMPMQAQAGNAGAQPLISPQQLVDTYNQMRSFPAGAASANQALQMLQRMAPEGFQMMADGSARLMPGISEGKGAIKGAEQNAANASDLYYKPQIEGRTELAKNPALIARENAAQLARGEQERLTQGGAPREVGPDKDIIYPPGSAGARNYFNAQLRGQKLPDNVTFEANGGVRVTGGNSGVFGKEVATLNAKQLLERRAVALDAAKSLENTTETRQLLRGMGDLPGTGANFSLAFRKGLTALGYPDDKVANTESFIATRASEVGRLIKQFGSGTGLSDADRAYATKMAAGDISLNKESITRILDITERASRNIITEHNKEAAKIPPGLSPYPLTVEMPNVTQESGERAAPRRFKWNPATQSVEPQ